MVEGGDRCLTFSGIHFASQGYTTDASGCEMVGDHLDHSQVLGKDDEFYVRRHQLVAEFDKELPFTAAVIGISGTFADQKGMAADLFQASDGGENWHH